MVSLDASVSSPLSGSARWMLFEEYQYDQGNAEWMRAQPEVVRSSDWKAYQAPSARYNWQFSSTAGVRYILAWAADGAGHLSRLPYQTLINYIPATDTLARDEARIYRYTLRAGEQLSAQVEAASGDADLYVWSSDPDTPPWLSNMSSGTDEIRFIAPADGTYQIEVHGYTATTYKLTVAVTQDVLDSSAAGGIDPVKPVNDRPLMSLDDMPSIRHVTPTGPPIYRSIYLPVLRQ